VFLAFYACQRLSSSVELEDLPFPGCAGFAPAERSATRIEPDLTMVPVQIPQASHEPLTAIERYRARDREPYQREGVYSGRLYGAFETSWFQDFQEDQPWTFLGPGAKKFWQLWGEEKVVPPAYKEWEETGVEPGLGVENDGFYPYLCVEATFRGRWVDQRCRDCAELGDAIVIEEMLTMKVVPLSAFDCIPAVGALARGEWPASARPGRTEAPTR
jgi:hypothetical protein